MFKLKVYSNRLEKTIIFTVLDIITYNDTMSYFIAYSLEEQMLVRISDKEGELKIEQEYAENAILEGF